MNDASAAEQKQIFDTPLEGADLEAVSALVNQHKANAALTQQLALDASKLVTTSQERLAKQSGAGFFRRLANVISGKTAENQLANQVDTLRMQKFAWHYLQQLQQQNLINAQSIAVIRNNLGTMNEYIIETRDFLEQAVDKIDRRLRHVENNVSFNSWSLSIESNKRRYKSTPKILLILRLAYDFMRVHPNAELTERDIGNYLVTTLEKLDINCDEDIRLLDFISELIDQVDIVGIAQYRAMVELSFDDHVVDSDFIQKNISGLGFNALYFLSDQYDRIAGLVGDEALCNSDEAREKIISKFFGQEFSGLSTTYSVRDLICEIIGGGQIAIEVYKEVHGLNAVEPEEVAEEAPQETVALVSALPDIQAHTYLDSQKSEASKRDYLLLFALCVENSASFNKQARDFIELLAEKAGLPGLHQEVLALADQPGKHKDYQAVMQSLLLDEDSKTTWLLDTFFLLSLAGKPIESPQIKTILAVLKPVQLKESFPAMMAMVAESDTSLVLEAVTKLAAHTQGWKNLVRYRALRFEASFAEPLKQLNAASWDLTRLMLEMGNVYAKGMEHAFFFNFSDGGFLGNLTDKAASTICSQGRKSALAGLNELRKKAGDCMSANRSALSRANGVISRWNMPPFECEKTVQSSDFDLDNSSSNEEWGDQFQHYYNLVDGALNAFSQACEDAIKQIEFFSNGDFDSSVVELREQKRAQAMLRQQQEKLEKQSVTIIKDGKEHLFGIEWRQIESPPCKPDDISHIKTNGKVWFVVARIGSDELFYRSEDRLHWQQVQLDTPNFKVWFDDIDVVNGIFIIKNRELSSGTREEGIYYSSDALQWRHCGAPEVSGNHRLSLNTGRLSYGNIIHFNGLWLWCVTQYQKYSYTEKGFFSDSTKTDSHATTILFCAATLNGPWKRWDQTPQLPEGVEAKAIHSLPGTDALLAFCEYDSSYIRNKKKPETPPFVRYFGARKEWQTCAWAGSTNVYRSRSPALAHIDGRLMYFSSGEVLNSDKGYEWNLQERNLNVDNCFPLKTLNIFTSRNNSAAMVLTQDGKLFKEVMLEEGNWSHITADEGGLVAVYQKNSYEPTVLRVGEYICQAKL